jgi:hypothetical protein
MIKISSFLSFIFYYDIFLFSFTMKKGIFIKISFQHKIFVKIFYVLVKSSVGNLFSYL